MKEEWEKGEPKNTSEELPLLAGPTNNRYIYLPSGGCGRDTGFSRKFRTDYDGFQPKCVILGNHSFTMILIRFYNQLREDGRYTPDLDHLQSLMCRCLRTSRLSLNLSPPRTCTVQWKLQKFIWGAAGGVSGGAALHCLQAHFYKVLPPPRIA